MPDHETFQFHNKIFTTTKDARTGNCVEILNAPKMLVWWGEQKCGGFFLINEITPVECFNVLIVLLLILKWLDIVIFAQS